MHARGVAAQTQSKMTFWGCALKPGQKQKVDLPEDEVLHLSQVCLHEPKAGKNYLSVLVNGSNYTFCCLEKDKIEHNSLDLFFGPEPPTFHNKGSSEVHISGYMEPKDEGDEDEEEEEEESEEEQVKDKIVGASTSSKASPKASPKTSPAAKAVEVKTSPKVSPKASPKAAATPAKGKKDAEEDSDEEGDEEEGEESEELEESEEKPAPKKKAAAKEAPKRKAEEATPPAKKAKTEASPKAAAAPSPNKAADKAAESEYTQQLVDFLKKNGKSKLSDLGSKVKRPAGVCKMKTIFDANKDKFVFAGDSVELKK